MGTANFPCGCSITTSMFGEHEVYRVNHCKTHCHLFSQDKSLHQMAEEIINTQRKDS